MLYVFTKQWKKDSHRAIPGESQVPRWSNVKSLDSLKNASNCVGQNLDSVVSSSFYGEKSNFLCFFHFYFLKCPYKWFVDSKKQKTCSSRDPFTLSGYLTFSCFTSLTLEVRAPCANLRNKYIIYLVSLTFWWKELTIVFPIWSANYHWFFHKNTFLIILYFADNNDSKTLEHQKPAAPDTETFPQQTRVDPGIPRRGGRQPLNLCWKLHENGKKFDREGARVPGPPFGSANANPSTSSNVSINQHKTPP